FACFKLLCHLAAPPSGPTIRQNWAFFVGCGIRKIERSESIMCVSQQCEEQRIEGERIHLQTIIVNEREGELTKETVWLNTRNQSGSELRLFPGGGSILEPVL